jgi:hypothetical protein
MVARKRQLLHESVDFLLKYGGPTAVSSTILAERVVDLRYQRIDIYLDEQIED